MPSPVATSLLRFVEAVKNLPSDSKEVDAAVHAATEAILDFCGEPLPADKLALASLLRLGGVIEHGSRPDDILAAFLQGNAQLLASAVDGPEIQSSNILASSLSMWLDSVLSGFEAEEFSALHLQAELRTWYMGNRHLLPEGAERQAMDRCLEYPAMQHSSSHAQSSLGLTPAMPRSPLPKRQPTTSHAPDTPSSLLRPGISNIGTEPSSQGPQTLLASASASQVPNAHAAAILTPAVPAVTVDPSKSIAAIRKTWARSTSKAWYEAVRDMHPMLSSETWFFGWSDTHFGYGTQQKCCGAFCPLMDSIGKSAPLLYRPVVAHFPKAVQVTSSRGPMFQQQPTVQLGCIYACSPNCAAEVADPPGKHPACPEIGPFHAHNVQPDHRLLAAAQKAAGARQQVGPPETSPAGAGAAVGGVGAGATPRKRQPAFFPPRFKAAVTLADSVWAEVVCSLPEQVRQQLMHNPSKTRTPSKRRKVAAAPAGQAAAEAMDLTGSPAGPDEDDVEIVE